MTTDAERREATDQWTIQLREQQLRDLRAQLAAVTQRAEAAEQALRLATAAKGASTIVMMTHEAYMDLLAQQAAATKRAEDAEAVLATIPMAPLLRFVEAILMRGQPLQFDVDAVGKWLKAQSRR